MKEVSFWDQMNKRLSDLEAKCARLEEMNNQLYGGTNWIKAISPEKKETPKEFSGYSTATPKYCYCPKDMPCDCGYNHDLDKQFKPSPAPEVTGTYYKCPDCGAVNTVNCCTSQAPEKTLAQRLANAGVWQSTMNDVILTIESHYRERFEKATKPGKAIPWHDPCNFTFTDYLRRELFGEKEGKS